MTTEIKCKLSSIAKDFALDSKTVAKILGIESAKPASTILTKPQLDVLFDKLSIEYKPESMEKALYQTPAKAKDNKAPDKPALKDKKVSAASVKDNESKASAKTETTPKPSSKAQAPHHKAQAHKPTQKLEIKPKFEENVNILSDATKPESNVVDTRGSDVNLSKYEVNVEDLVSEKANKFNQTQNKQKIVKKSDSRKPFGQKKRYEEQQKLNKLQMQQNIKKTPLKVLIPDEIVISEFASRLKKTATDVIKQLMKMGVMATINETIDFDTASLIAMEFGAVVSKEVFVTIEEKLFIPADDDTGNLLPRSPIVVVMGHVDHGKTSLLDAIRNKEVAAGEAGGITQHIGAYMTSINNKNITFLDTPGHAAFTSMRARGASITDVAVLVVAADDGVMPQTIEAINHAKAANTPIIVAVNKMDKEGANPDRVLEQLAQHDVITEDWGGDTIVCKISAKKREGLDNLLEMILLVAEMGDLKANPDRRASGAVIEAKLDRGRGPVATVLVQTGTLNIGDVIIAGTSVGRVRAMTDDIGNKKEKATPSMPVEIIGLSHVPNAGDAFHVVEDERMARELAEQRLEREKMDKNNAISKVTLDNIFDHIQDGSVKSLNVILKADVHGSAEALRASLEKIACDEVRVKVIHCGVGAITESDIMLAAASGAIIVGFNVRPEKVAADLARESNVDMRLYSIIYQAIEEMEQAMKGMLAPTFKEEVLGHAEIRQTFKVTGVGTIAGCYVLDGKIARNAQVRIVRDGIVIHEGELDTLKRFKDDAKEVASGYECGISIVKFNDIKELDIIEAFIMVEVKR